MRRVVRSPAARADLLEIFAFLYQRNPEAARRYVRGIVGKFDDLAFAPGIGQKRLLHTKVELLSVPYRNHLIFYRTLPEAIEIVRVLHGATNWAGTMTDD